jgi:hypothetical protein
MAPTRRRRATRYSSGNRLKRAPGRMFSGQWGHRAPQTTSRPAARYAGHVVSSALASLAVLGLVAAVALFWASQSVVSCASAWPANRKAFAALSASCRDLQRGLERCSGRCDRRYVGASCANRAAVPASTETGTGSRCSCVVFRRGQTGRTGIKAVARRGSASRPFHRRATGQRIDANDFS